MKIFSLGDSPPEKSAAIQLAKVGHVQLGIRGDSADLDTFHKAGFVSVPNNVECCINLPLDPGQRPRKWRRNLQQSINQWHQAGLGLHLTTVENMGVERLIDELYFPIFLPNFYARGISPYGAHNLATFRAIARPELYVAQVVQQGHIVGGGLLRPRRPATDSYPLKGSACAGDGVEGMIYVLGKSYEDCRRAFLFHLCAAFSSIGMKCLSLGPDLFWFDGRYVPILKEKIRWADTVLANHSEPKIVFSVHPKQFETQHGLVLFSQEEKQSVLRGYGPAGTKAANDLAGTLPGCTVRKSVCSTTD